MKILSETFLVPYGLNELSDGLVPIDHSAKDTYRSREVVQFRSTLSVLVEDEVYTAETTHSCEEIRQLQAQNVPVRATIRRHHRALVLAKIESVLFPE